MDLPSDVEAAHREMCRRTSAGYAVAQIQTALLCSSRSSESRLVLGPVAALTVGELS